MENPEWVKKVLSITEEGKNSKRKASYFSLNDKALERLKQCKSHGNIISYPVVFQSICRLFTIKKSECWALLRYFQSIGKLEFVCCQGIRLLY